MKLTQKDKIMLALLCVVMVLAGVFMLVVRPMTDEKLELEAELALEQDSWDNEASTVIQSFYSEADAQHYWQMSSANLNNSINLLLYDGKYLLGNAITDKMGESVTLAETSNFLPVQKKFAIVEYINDNFLDDYIGSENDISTGEITYTEYVKSEAVEGGSPEVYIIASCKISVENFVCENDYDFYDMINKMEKSGYILIDDVNYLDGSGSISFTVLMTPGDLSDYNVILGSNGKFIMGDSTRNKYTGEQLE